MPKSIKSKIKFKSAADAQRARQLASDWSELENRWGVAKIKQSVVEKLNYNLTAPAGRETARHRSVDTGHLGAVSTKQTPQYSGDKILGISVLHKSNGVPVFSKEEIHDIAKMRRG